MYTIILTFLPDTVYKNETSAIMSDSVDKMAGLLMLHEGSFQTRA
jgi:hypothetical protein